MPRAKNKPLFGGFSKGAGNPSMEAVPAPLPPAPEPEKKPAPAGPVKKFWSGAAGGEESGEPLGGREAVPDLLTTLLEVLGVAPKQATEIKGAFDGYMEAQLSLRQFRKYPQYFAQRMQMGKDKDWFYKTEWQAMRVAEKYEDALKRLEERVSPQARRVLGDMRAAMRDKAAKSNPQQRRNADDAPDGKSPWFTVGGMRNWLILAGILVGGYFIYKKWLAPKLSQAFTVPAKGPGALPAKAAGMRVTANQVTTTDSMSAIGARRAGYDYAKVLITHSDGSREFVPSTSGTFTGNLLNEGGGLWAEILPA